MQVDKEKYLDGQVLLIDKDLDWTSFDVVNKIRRAIQIKKVGHAGTLDPLATGLLIVCTGKMTKKIQQFQDQPKQYTGKFYLGATRPSHDKETDVESTSDISTITNDQIKDLTKLFIGEIDQIPPLHSAIKKDGVRLYTLARKGESIKVDSRKVFVKSFQIDKIELPYISFSLTCSKGFYVRALARDFGEQLGCGAYLDELRRTAIGDFSVNDSVSIKKFIETLDS